MTPSTCAALTVPASRPCPLSSFTITCALSTGTLAIGSNVPKLLRSASPVFESNQPKACRGNPTCETSFEIADQSRCRVHTRHTATSTHTQRKSDPAHEERAPETLLVARPSPPPPNTPKATQRPKRPHSRRRLTLAIRPLSVRCMLPQKSPKDLLALTFLNKCSRRHSTPHKLASRCRLSLFAPTDRARSRRPNDDPRQTSRTQACRRTSFHAPRLSNHHLQRLSLALLSNRPEARPLANRPRTQIPSESRPSLPRRPGRTSTAQMPTSSSNSNNQESPTYACQPVRKHSPKCSKSTFKRRLLSNDSETLRSRPLLAC